MSLFWISVQHPLVMKRWGRRFVSTSPIRSDTMTQIFLSLSRKTLTRDCDVSLTHRYNSDLPRVEVRWWWRGMWRGPFVWRSVYVAKDSTLYFALLIKNLLIPSIPSTSSSTPYHDRWTHPTVKLTTLEQEKPSPIWSYLRLYSSPRARPVFPSV